MEAVILITERFEREKAVRLQGADRLDLLKKAEAVPVSGNVTYIDRVHEVVSGRAPHQEAPSAKPHSAVDSSQNEAEEGEPGKVRLTWETRSGQTYWLFFSAPTTPMRRAARALEQKGWERLPHKEGFYLWPRAALLAGGETLFDAWRSLPASTHRKAYMREAEEEMRKRAIAPPPLPAPAAESTISRRS